MLERTFRVTLKDDTGADRVKSKGEHFKAEGAASSVSRRKKCGVSQELPLDGAVARDKAGETNFGGFSSHIYSPRAALCE